MAEPTDRDRAAFFNAMDASGAIGIWGHHITAIARTMIPAIAVARAEARREALEAPVSDAEAEAAAMMLCCGNECDAVNACVGHDISPDGYAERYGCLSKDRQDEARAAIAAAFRVRAGAR